MGSSAFVARSGVMIIEKGQVAMVASGSMASLATIEDPDDGRAGYVVSESLSARRGHVARA